MATARRSRLSTDVRREQLDGLGIDMLGERPFDEVGFAEAASLGRLESRAIMRDELRELLMGVLCGAVHAAFARR